MSRHEIDIEGLPEGFEPVLLKVLSGPLEGGSFGAILRCRRKVRKYDWSKTMVNTLITLGNCKTMHLLIDVAGKSYVDMRISDVWQPNIHGKCPVDGESCIVRVRCSYGHEHEGLASSFNWDPDLRQYVTAYQFIRLADGVEWV